MELFLDIERSKEALLEAKRYLSPFFDHEEGGMLLGKRIWSKNRTLLTVEILQFIPIVSGIKTWELSATDMETLVLPDESIGYYPDPKRVFSLKQTIFPLNESSQLMEVGFIHNHMNNPANPSIYDRTHVCREFGYIMSIYSNKYDHIKNWYVAERMETQKEWETISKQLNLLAQVELALTL